MHTVLWSDHSWFVLTTEWDWLRVVLWCVANLITAFTYFAIPVEIWKWYKAVPMPSTLWISTAFISFIMFCGIHHLVDVIIMPTAPWWAIFTANIPMAIASVATWVLLGRLQSTILIGLRAIAFALNLQGAVGGGNS